MFKTLLVVPAILIAAAGEPQQPADTAAGIQPAVTRVSDKPDADERDIGLAGFAPAACVPVYSQQVSAVGPAAGDPEKDNFARTTVGETCR